MNTLLAEHDFQCKVRKHVNGQISLEKLLS